jgi:hypothetical protein
MATFTGKDGELQIATNAIAQLSTWSLETTAEPVESSVIGNEWRRYKASMKGYTVTGEGYYDIADTGQGGLVIGASVAFLLYPAGNTSGEKEYAGNAFVTAFSETAGFDTMVSFTFSLQGDDALVETAVTP